MMTDPMKMTDLMKMTDRDPMMTDPMTTDPIFADPSLSLSFMRLRERKKMPSAQATAQAAPVYSAGALSRRPGIYPTRAHSLASYANQTQTKSTSMPSPKLIVSIPRPLVVVGVSRFVLE
jgi:hypothetical protein